MRSIRWSVLAAVVAIVLVILIPYFLFTSRFIARVTDSWGELVSTQLNREKADGLIRQADQKLRESNYKENIRLLKEAGQLDPSNPRVWWKLCEGYQLTEELDLAVDACKRNIEVHEGDALSYNSLGLAYAAQKNYAEAAKAFAVAAKGDESAPVLSNLVDALCHTKQFERALPAAQRVTELDAAENSGELGGALQRLGGIYIKLGQKEKAQEVLNRFCKLHPEWASMTCHWVDDDIAGGSVTCSSKSAPTPHAGSIQIDENYSAGLAYLPQERYSEAAAAFERATQSSKNPFVYYQYVWALVKSGQYERAIAPAQKWVELSAGRQTLGQDNALGMLGAIYAKLGQMDKAEEAFSRANKVNPNLGTCEFLADDKGELSLNCNSTGWKVQ